MSHPELELLRRGETGVDVTHVTDAHADVEAHNPSAPRARMDRRSALAGGVGAAAAMGLGALMRPEAARAVTTDVIRDQGGMVFNALAYNGGAFNHTTINSAISAAASAGGGIVFIPEGTWSISGNIDITADNIHLVGAGGSTLLEIQSIFTGDAITITKKTGCGVRNLMITAASSTARTAGSAIKITGNKDNNLNPANVVIEDVNMKFQFDGIVINDHADGTGSWLVFINRGTYYGFKNGGTGIWINSNNGGLHFVSHITMVGPTYPTAQPKAGIRVQGTGDLTLYACVAIQTETGLLIDPPNGKIVAALFCESCDWDTTGVGNGVAIIPAVGGLATQLNFVNCWTNASKEANGIYIGGNVDRVNVIGHRAYGNQTNGIWVNAGGAKNVSIDSSEFSGNNVANAGHAGIRLGSAGNNMSDVQVRDCRCTASHPFAGGNTQAYGVIVAANTNDFMLVANNLRGNVTGALSDSGGSNKVVADNLTT